MLSLALLAGFWGLVGGSTLVLGAFLGWRVRMSQAVVAGIMAFGAGVLVSALAFDLMEHAYDQDGASSLVGFAVGGIVYSATNWALARHGAKHRKRSGNQQPSEAENPGSGLAIAAGALLDGIPESVAIGASLLAG